MSANNQLIVTKLEDDHKMYGVFYDGCVDDDLPPSWFVKENAETCFLSPTNAILEAHRIQQERNTEYGVYVHTLALRDARSEFFTKTLPNANRLGHITQLGE